MDRTEVFFQKARCFLTNKKKKKPRRKTEKSVDQYTHEETKRPNNPPVGLVTPKTDPDQLRKKYAYDPRLAPQLQWSGKKENSEFDVDTVSLHVHERIDPLTILEKTLKPKQQFQQTLLNFFDTDENNPPLRDAIDFYKHNLNWSNRLVAGDSLLVMNSLLEKEGMEGKVQMIYIDPPYGIKYGSNFQPFVNKRVVTDGKDEDLTQEPETIKAFRDTWELGIHSYLTYFKARILLAKKLLNNTGSCFVQIGDENIHHVREILDDVFGSSNFIATIAFKKKKMPLGETFIFTMCDYILWYSKDRSTTKFNRAFVRRNFGEGTDFSYVELEDGKWYSVADYQKKIEGSIKTLKTIRYFQSMDMRSSGRTESCVFEYEFNGKKYFPSGGKSWKTNLDGMKTLTKKKRLFVPGNTLRYKFYYDDYPVQELSHMWMDLQGASDKTYVVQTSTKAIERCMLMTTDPGDLVFDPTCGSGTTAYVAEKWGRRWITCDTSRISTTLTKQRLMTSSFDYFDLLKPAEGISSGFDYETVPHITLGSIANNEEPPAETLYDKPKINQTKTRISGPFTVEAVPAPTVKSLDLLSEEYFQSEPTIAQNLTTSHQQQWRDELLKTGIRGKSGQKIEFSSVETHPATRWLHADAETKEDTPKRVAISFGPEHVPLEQRQVELAIEEAQTLVPKPTMIIFAAMQFDPEAAKDIDELNWPGITILKAEMNKDLLTKDLKKKRSSNESFWLIGQPDVDLEKTDEGKYVVRVNGFDYYNTANDEIESGGSSKIAMWMLDTDYDGRSVYPQQVFFPMEGKDNGWNRLAKTLCIQLDKELIAKYEGIEAIPFESGPNKRIAVKIIDDRGIESVKIMDLE